MRIEIGPVVTMPLSAMTLAMATMDQGQPVNHHFEVHVFDKTTGAVVRDVVPQVTIADRATGSYRGVPSVMACMTLRHRDIAPHFGDNLFLVDGTYHVTVGVGSETVVIENVAVKAAGPPAM
ncbi:MAG: hypothetical protein HY685_05545 [Chloroflexi bacterium]|nr:hypothetical protein [Chloroflexota bacterium]